MRQSPSSTPLHKLAFFTTWCPVKTSIDTLAKVEGHRWAIEDSFETAKNEPCPTRSTPS
jgi:SRSO17 transposase